MAEFSILRTEWGDGQVVYSIIAVDWSSGSLQMRESAVLFDSYEDANVMLEQLRSDANDDAGMDATKWQDFI